MISNAELALNLAARTPSVSLGLMRRQISRLNPYGLYGFGCLLVDGCAVEPDAVRGWDMIRSAAIFGIPTAAVRCLESHPPTVSGTVAAREMRMVMDGANRGPLQA